MKLRSLVLWSLGGIALSVTVVMAALPSDAAAQARTEVAVRSASVDDGAPVAAASEEPAAEGALAVRTRVGHSVLDARGDRHTFLLLDLVGRGSGERTTAAATNTALVLDTSGSMAGARIHHALDAARGWVTRARDGDAVSLTTFSDRAFGLAPAVEIAEGRGRVLRLLGSLAVDGSTCISCGLETAGQQLDAGDDRVKRMVLLSDGEANLGLQTVSQLRQLAHTFRSRGVSITTVGVGTSFDSETMATLAFESNGLHHFVATPSDLPSVFEREAEGLASTVADGVTAELSLGRGVSLVRVFDRSGQRSGDSTRVAFGSVAEGEQRTLMVEVRAPASVGEHELATVTLSFRDVARQRAQTVQRRMSCRVAERASSAVEPLVQMRVQRSMTAAALLRSTEMLQADRRSEAMLALARRRRGVLEAMARFGGNASADASDARTDLARQLDEIRRMETEVEQARDRARAQAATRRMRERAMPLMF